MVLKDTGGSALLFAFLLTVFPSPIHRKLNLIFIFIWILDTGSVMDYVRSQWLEGLHRFPGMVFPT